MFSLTAVSSTKCDFCLKVVWWCFGESNNLEVPLQSSCCWSPRPSIQNRNHCNLRWWGKSPTRSQFQLLFIKLPNAKGILSPKIPIQEFFDQFENVSLVESCLVTGNIACCHYTFWYFLLVVGSRKLSSKLRSSKFFKFAVGDCLAIRLGSQGCRADKPLIGLSVARLSCVSQTPLHFVSCRPLQCLYA